MEGDKLEGTMMEGVDVNVGWSEVGRAVSEVMKTKGEEVGKFVRDHPREATLMLTGALVLARLALAGRVSAQGPISGDPNYPDVLKFLTNNDAVAKPVVDGIVTATETTSSC